MKYNILLIDPPWSFADSLQHDDVKRGASSNYNVMNIEDIYDMDIKSISDDQNGALLCLWVPSSFLREGLECLDRWGFELKQTFIWVKIQKESSIEKMLKKSIEILNKKIKINSINEILNKTCSFFMGRLFRNCHEICLIGTNNTKIYKLLKNKSQRTVCFDQNLKHSKKTEILQDRLELMFPESKKVEVFARRIRYGWDCIGFEVSNEDIDQSIEKLKNK